MVNFLNVYGPGLAILFVVFVEAAGVFWFYGVDNFSTDVESMIGERPGLFWRVCWMYISPTFLLVIFIFSLLGYEDMLGEEYIYPEWSIVVGWILTLSSILCIPIYIIYKILITPGTIKQVCLPINVRIFRDRLHFVVVVLLLLKIVFTNRIYSE